MKTIFVIKTESSMVCHAWYHDDPNRNNRSLNPEFAKYFLTYDDAQKFLESHIMKDDHYIGKFISIEKYFLA